MTITTLPAAPTPADSTSVFNDRAFAFVASLANFVTEVNATALEVDADAATATTQAGVATTQAGVATTQAGVALGHATDAGVAQTAAEAAQAAAEAAVATLPPGTINDMLVGPTTAWSSEKTNAEILLAKNYPGDVLRTARSLSAPEYLPCDDGAAYLKSSYPDLAGEIGFLYDAVWTERTSSYGYSAISGAAYGAGVYVTCGAANKVASSPDGVTWTQRTSGLATGGLNAAIYADGRFVVAGAGGGCAYSADGTSWTVGGAIGGMQTFALAYGAGLYVAVGNVGQLYTSPTAVTWTSRTSSFDSVIIYSVAYGAGVFVATGESGKIATSPDGITWTQQTSPFLGTETVARVLFDGGKFVALAQASGSISKIATSPDGITWTLVASLSHPGFSATGLAFDGQLYVLIAGTYIYASDDGANWTLAPTPLAATGTTNLVAAGGLFLATGSTGKLFTSPGLTYDLATQFVTPVVPSEPGLSTYIKA